jgi:hypothetical protein
MTLPIELLRNVVEPFNGKARPVVVAMKIAKSWNDYSYGAKAD